MTVVEVFGGLGPYNEAVLVQLAAHDIGPGPRAVGSNWVAIVHCDQSERWEQLAELVDDPACVVVAVLPTLELDGYVRALGAGAAGVVYVDTSSVITAEVVVSATQGEVVLPRQAAQSIAFLAQREKPDSDLNEAETALLRAVSAGRTVADIAKELHYSERTVRRHLQSVYIKVGAKNRAEAIAAGGRLGLSGSTRDQQSR